MHTRTHRSIIVAALVPFLVASACDDEVARLTSPVEWYEVTTPVGVLDVAVVPPMEPGTTSHPVLLALPWGSGDADLTESFVRSYWAEAPSARGYYVVAPAVYGPRLEDDADQILPALFDWVESTLGADAQTVALVGASNGGRGAFFAALADPARFDAMLVLPGVYAGEAATLAPLADIPIRMIVGEFDTTWVDATLATRDALESVGIMPTVDIADAQGHVMNLLGSELVHWIDEVIGR
ncbi:MAG: alpha/beta hydrolase-fold protein [Longimicrobiales bacterium]